MSASNSNNMGAPTVFQERAARRSTTGRIRTPAPVKRAIDVLRHFARVWVESQQHRNGF
jgi:hypothetical protein